MSPSYETLEQVLEQHRDAIMAMPHVVGVGIGECGSTLCITVMVSERSVELQRALAALLKDCPYRVDETEPFQPLPSAREP